MGMIVSIHSYRGGTGKSNLTANLATAVAATGRRVGIVDTDIQSPGIHILFTLNEKQITRPLNECLYGQFHTADTAYPMTPPGVAAAGGSVYLIPSSLKAGEIARVLKVGDEVAKLHTGVDVLLEKLDLDYLFIDTHPGMNEETLLSIAISDVLVLILRPDSQDFQGTAVTVEVARKLEVPNMRLVLNKVPPALDRQKLVSRVTEIY